MEPGIPDRCVLRLAGAVNSRRKGEGERGIRKGNSLVNQNVVVLSVIVTGM